MSVVNVASMFIISGVLGSTTADYNDVIQHNASVRFSYGNRHRDGANVHIRVYYIHQ